MIKIVAPQETQHFNILVYTIFEESYIPGMMELKKAGLELIRVPDLMERRLEVLYLPKNHPLRECWLNNHSDTAECFGYFENKVKIILDSQVLKEINPESKLSYGALVLTPEQYSAIEGEEFLIEDLKKAGLLGYLTKEQAKEKPIWRILARDQHLLNEYVDAVFALAEETYCYEKNMRVWLAHPQQNPVIHGLRIANLLEGSNAYGSIDLRDNDARLVGVLPGEGIELEERILQAIKAGYSFISGNNVYTPTPIKKIERL